MKRSNHTLNYHNLYVEGFALLFLVIGWSEPLCFFVLMVYLVWQRKRIRWQFLGVLIMLLLGRYLMFSYGQDIENINDKVKIIHIDTYDHSQRLTISYQWHHYHVYVYHDDYQVGDQVLIKGTIDPYVRETIPDGFHAKQYYKSINVLGKIDLESIEKMHAGFSIWQYRTYWMTHVKTTHASFVKAFVFGSDLSDDTSDVFKQVNLLFLIQTTGLHAFVIVSGIKKMMFYVDVKEKHQPWVVTSIYGILCYLNGFGLGVVRLLCTQVFNLINQKYHMRMTPLDRLFIIGFLMIVINFSWVYSVGFLMTLLILLTLELARERYQGYHGYLKRLVMSLLILFACLPFTKYINIMVLLCLPILILWVTIVIYPLSFIVCFTSRFDPLYGFLINVLMTSVDQLQIKGLTLRLPALNHWQMLLYYGIFAYMLLAYKKRQLITRGMLLCSLFGYQVISHNFHQESKVYFLDVGQGDTTYIETSTCKAMIDSFSGSSDFLKNRGIYQLDYLFLTHSDKDHTLDAASIIQDIGVDQVIVNPYDHHYENYVMKLTKGYANTSYVCGDLVFDILGPLHAYNEPNLNSLVMMVAINNDTYLFTGDINQAVESELVHVYKDRLKSDILKVAHHGSNTSTSDIWIKTVMPRDAVIMVGRNNSFGFPHHETLDTLMRYGVKIHRTDESGTIIMTYHEVKRLWETTLSIYVDF